MAGTRTAPTVGAITTTSSGATIHLIDASGDLHSETVYAVGDALADLAEVEALVVDYQAATQASVWKVTQTFVWEGDADPDNAEVGQRNSVKDGINLLFKNVALLKSQTPRLVAPVGATMQGNQDIPLLSSTEMTNLITQYLVAALAGYNLASAQYTERRERSNNPRVK